MLDERQLKRVIQFLGMASVDNDAEALSFNRAAQRLVKDNGETWEALLLPALARPAGGAKAKPEPEPDYWTPPPPREPEWMPAVKRLAQHRHRFNQWENDFLDSLFTQLPRVLSQPRIDVLSRMWAKIGGDRG